jgi:hypothetical protein
MYAVKASLRESGDVEVIGTCAAAKRLESVLGGDPLWVSPQVERRPVRSGPVRSCEDERRGARHVPPAKASVTSWWMAAIRRHTTASGCFTVHAAASVRGWRLARDPRGRAVSITGASASLTTHCVQGLPMLAPPFDPRGSLRRARGKLAWDPRGRCLARASAPAVTAAGDSRGRTRRRSESGCRRCR